MNWLYLIPVVAIVGLALSGMWEVIPATILVLVACLGAAWLEDWMSKKR